MCTVKNMLSWLVRKIDSVQSITFLSCYGSKEGICTASSAQFVSFLLTVVFITSGRYIDNLLITFSKQNV